MRERQGDGRGEVKRDNTGERETMEGDQNSGLRPKRGRERETERDTEEAD